MKHYNFIHLFFVNSPVFTQSTIELIQDLKSEYSHLYVLKYENGFEIQSDYIIDNNIDTMSRLQMYSEHSDYLVFHSMGIKNETIAELDSIILSKIIWCIWGHDLYNRFTSHDESLIILEAINKLAQIKSFVVGFEGDKFVLQSVFGPDIQINDALYPSGYYLDDVKRVIQDDIQSKNKKYNILLGHSAFKYEQHMKYIDVFSNFKSEDFCIHIPMAYGDKNYIEMVKKSFEESSIAGKVNIYTEFMNYEKYIQLLNSIDIAVFDWDKQAGLGNIYLLLFLGKKIYLSPTGILYKTFNDMDLKVFSVKDLCDEELCSSRLFDSNVNKNYAINRLDKEIISNQWKRLFTLMIES